VSLGRYSILVLGVVAVTLGLAWPLVLRRCDSSALQAVALGLTIALLNTLAAHGLVRWSAGRSTRAFLRAVLGGTVARVALMLAALLAGMLLLELPRVPLALSLLFYFVVFLTMELLITHRRTLAPTGAAR
jgi:hypothetical protein